MKEKNKENKNSKNKQFKKGFTLIEMLVVVLIIGILAGIALPQYTLAVEKARSAEVLMNLATIKREIQFYITANGLPTSGRVEYKDFATVDLSGGEWDGDAYTTKFYRYYAMNVKNIGESVGGYIEIDRNVDDYFTIVCSQYEISDNDTQMNDGWYCSCYTQRDDFGRKMCKAIYEPLGFKYVDSEL